MKISVVIPVYNMAQYLKDALESLLRQNHKDWVAICVDDGSSDDSGRILDEYALRDKRFTVIHQKNMGVGAARNVALEMINSEWLVFLDPDDYLRDNAFEQIASVIAENPSVDLVRFGFKSFRSPPPPRFESTNKSNVIMYDMNEGLDTRFLNSLVWDNAYSVSLIKDIRFKSYVTGEDQAWLAECMVRVYKIAQLEESLYFYRIRDNSLSHGRYDLRRWASGVNATKDELITLSMCQRPVLGPRAHWCCVRIEEYAFSLINQLTKEERRDALNQWYSTLETIIPLRCVTKWTKIVAMLNLLFRSAIVASITCGLPYWLKKRGITRGGLSFLKHSMLLSVIGMSTLLANYL